VNRAKRQSQPAMPHRTVLAHAQVGTSRPLVVELGGWRVSVRNESAPQPAHGWYARRIPRHR
jgi:hypothetical protein